MTKPRPSLAFLVVTTLALSACGVRGSLESPSHVEPTAEASSGQGKPEGTAPKPHKGFILDGLLR